MSEIKNNEILKGLRNITGLQASIDEIPSQLARAIVPVIVANPERLIQTKTATASDLSSVTIHTTSSTKDTYLIGGEISTAKDAFSTSIFSQITATAFGSSSANFLILRYEPLTAGSSSQSISLSRPLKLERNSAINVINSTAVASIDTTGTIFFYETENE